QTEKRYVYKSTIRTEYGLTPSMIRELGPPDEYVENPHYRSAPEASLYLLERVEAWIAKNPDRLEKAKASRAVRSARAKKAYEERRARQRQAENERLLIGKEWVKTLNIVVHKPFPMDLAEKAEKRNKFRTGVPLLEQRGLHSFVRHRLTNYERLLRE